jgi:hypothetical protein
MRYVALAFLLCAGTLLLLAGRRAGAQCPGNCQMGDETVGGLAGYNTCPSRVSLWAHYGTIAESSSACQFSCKIGTADSAFSSPECVTAVLLAGGVPQSITSTVTATFDAGNCNPHYLSVLTSVIAAYGTIYTYPSNSVGTYCARCE